MHFATDLAPQTARQLAASVRKIADRYNARHPEALLRVTIDVGEPRLQAETAERICAISIEVEETLSPVGTFAGEISSLVGGGRRGAGALPRDRRRAARGPGGGGPR
jgi:hypothetical protein